MKSKLDRIFIKLNRTYLFGSPFYFDFFFFGLPLEKAKILNTNYKELLDNDLSDNNNKANMQEICKEFPKDEPFTSQQNKPFLVTKINELKSINTTKQVKP